MPKKKKSTVLLVFGILNIVFGGFGLFGGICGGLAIFGTAQMTMPGGAPNPIKDMLEYMDKHAPSYSPFVLTQLVIDLILSIVLIVCGIGLIKVRQWARWMSVGYSLVRLVMIAIGLLVTILVFNPVLADWQADYNKRATPAGAPPQPSFGSGATNNITSACASILGAAYSIALLTVMFLPTVRVAFADGSRSDDERDDRYDDDRYDDDRPDILDRRDEPDDRFRR